MTTGTTGQRGYALPNDWDLAERRLALLEACHDGSSIRHAEALGVRRGWRCLEAGAGHGSFARWLAARVGPEGSVVAADIDVRLLEHLDVPGLDVRRMDVAADPLPREAFDFVHTRHLLIHVPSRDDLLARLAATLRPGGLLMVEEDDIHPIVATAAGAYRDAWEAFVRMMRGAGLDPEWARGLPDKLVALGLAGVDAELDGQLFAGRSTAAQFWSLTWLQARERVSAMGVPREVIDRGRAALDDQSRWFHGPAKVIAWGRRPAR